VSEADTASLTEYDFTLALKIVDGTRGYSGTEGDLSLDYAAVRFNPPECSPCTSEDSGTLTGTITRRSATAAPLASPFLAR
jgi:hypothetical protein